ncbi:MAG: MFS transporter [Marinilabiliaceae bacterium]|nr:MFS transporter [Marinilabiliaceae bacterium]
MTTEQKTKTSFGILIALSLSHFFNDTLQAIITAVYPLLKSDLLLSFRQIGYITLFYQASASVFQPILGLFLDKRPKSYFLMVGMCCTFIGLCTLAYSDSFAMTLASVSLVGIGSSVLHPEASRLTSIASGGKRGLAQSVFQVGGNAGCAVGPLLAALFIAPYGRQNIALVALIAIIGICVIIPIKRWYSGILKSSDGKKSAQIAAQNRPLSRGYTIFAICILLVLIFSKYFYMASLSSYYTFYVIERFGVSVQTSQIMLFVFLAATAIGTLIGGPLGDRIGRKYVIWISILGASPFALLMPGSSLTSTIILSFMVGLMISSAFPAILIYAQILLPNHLGLVSGLFFGFAFGIAGISSAVLGYMVDSIGLEHVFRICSFIPLLGLTTCMLPNIEKGKRRDN